MLVITVFSFVQDDVLKEDLTVSLPLQQFVNMVYYIHALSNSDIDATVHLGCFYYLVKEGCTTAVCKITANTVKDESVSLTVKDLETIDILLEHVEHAVPEMALLTPYFCYI